VVLRRIKIGSKMLQVQEIELTKLQPWQDNPRLNDHAVEAVAKSINSFGFNVPLYYVTRT
jgi:hypothetical protein